MERNSQRKICLFAHYDPRHRIRPHVLGYLTALREAGYNVVVACSGDRLPPDDDRDAVYATGASLFFRINQGLDFGAWQDLIRAGYADGAETVLLANDSVFGPFADLAPIISRMCARRLDVWGMVESLQIGWHLQSWFLHFSAAAFTAPAIRRVFSQPFDKMTKEEIINRGEVALGSAILEEGLSCDAVVRHVHGAWMARLLPMNPMHINWRHLLVSRQLPFIKVGLLRENAMNIPWIEEWAEILRACYGTAPEELSQLPLQIHGLGASDTRSAISDTSQECRTARPSCICELLSRDHGSAVRALAGRLMPFARKGFAQHAQHKY